MKFPTEECPLMVIELFAGIGAQAMALKNAGIPHKIAAISEIDKNAIRSYMAIHGETLNLGDISKIESLPSFPDNPTLWTYSFPCQDISVAGLQKGFTENTNTRSSLLWEVHRLVKDAYDKGCPPGYLLMENVDAILNEKNLPNFLKWVARLSEMGYTSSWKVLNSKNFGVPQNRKRCFMMSARDGMKFQFDEGTPTTIRLKDILEENVPESFYLSDERIAKYEQRIDDVKGSKATKVSEDNQGIIVSGDLNQDGRFESANRTYDAEGIAPTIPTCGGGGIVPKIEVAEGDDNTNSNQDNATHEIEEGNDPKMVLAGELTNKTYEQGKKVWDPDGISPCICARDYKEPAKIEVCGNLNDESRLEEHNCVHSVEGISPAVTARNEQPIIDEESSVQIVGTFPDTNVEQAKRVYGTDGLSPAVTAGGGSGSIAKIEIKGDLHDETRPEMHNRIYGTEGIAPTLYANGGSEPAPKIEEEVEDMDTDETEDSE